MAWGLMRPGGGKGTVTRKSKRISISGNRSSVGTSTVDVADILSELSDGQVQELTTENFVVSLDNVDLDSDGSYNSVAQRVMVSAYSPSAKTVSLQYQTSYNSSSVSANLYMYYAE